MEANMTAQILSKIELSTIVKALAFFQANLDQEMIDEAIEDESGILVTETELSQLEAKVESLLTKVGSNFDFTLYDEVNDIQVTGNINTKGGPGLAIYFEGFGDCSSADNMGTPVYIEKFDGELFVRVYSDINSDAPTHTIPLEGARLDKRLPE
jgi:hypothetical protein